jgi:hypothetical protein
MYTTLLSEECSGTATQHAHSQKHICTTYPLQKIHFQVLKISKFSEINFFILKNLRKSLDKLTFGNSEFVKQIFDIFTNPEAVFLVMCEPAMNEL